jgi:hypothetical protein
MIFINTTIKLLPIEHAEEIYWLKFCKIKEAILMFMIGCDIILLTNINIRIRSMKKGHFCGLPPLDRNGYLTL